MKSPESSSIQSSARRPGVIIGLLALGLAAGCGSQGKPQVVAEVPAQVDYKKSQAEYDPSNPPLWPTVYYLGLEQCPADIEAAKAGKPISSPSFDPATHTYSQDCFIQRVEVPRAVYDKYAEGDTIIFDGKVGEPIGRVTG